MAVNFITPPCIVCSETSVLTVTEEELVRVQSRDRVQDIFPHWTADERELVITGTHPKCWDTFMFDEDDK
jgi:hypothetical protein